jgi:hypothetical protein
LQRLGLIDGLRGYFLVFMFLSHQPWPVANNFLWIHHSNLSFVEDAQGFVFLSGLMVGLIYGRRMMKRGFADEAWALWRRGAQLYAWAVGCIVAILVMRNILPGAPEAWLYSLGPLDKGGALIVGTALLVYQPQFLDILTQYVVYILVAPPLLWLCLTGRWHWVAAGSVILWLAVQIGMHRPLVDLINRGLSILDPDLTLHANFNVLAWQVVFCGAMIIGALWAQGKIEFELIFDPRKTLLLRAFGVSLLFFLLMRHDIGPADLITTLYRDYATREEFSLVYLANFVLLAYVVAWLLMAGPRSEHKPVAVIGRGLTWLFSLSFLRLLGRHSLTVYAWHTVLVYTLIWCQWAFCPPIPSLAWKVSEVAIVLFCVGLLALPTVYSEPQVLINERTRSLMKGFSARKAQERAPG